MFDSTSEFPDAGNRRHFLKVAAALTTGAALARTAQAAEATGAPTGIPQTKEPSSLRIGILAGTFARPTLEATLDAVKTCGLDCIQLSMDRVGLSPLPNEVPAELSGRIRRKAAARGITIASLQGTFNMCHPDAEHRQAGLRGIEGLAAACGPIGASMIHICTGTRDRDNMWRCHPDNDSPEAWRDMIACVRAATVIAERAGVTLGFEPEVNNVVDSAKKARRLLDEIHSPRLKVTMDAANLFHAGELARMAEILDQAFALVGKDIAMAHAKDLNHDGDAGHEAAGHGRLDYDRYLSLLHAYGFKGPLFLHGLSEAQVPGCVAFLREKLARITKTRT
jgi:sugar phosphate isomerase/epimerase